MSLHLRSQACCVAVGDEVAPDESISQALSRPLTLAFQATVPDCSAGPVRLRRYVACFVLSVGAMGVARAASERGVPPTRRPPHRRLDRRAVLLHG